MNAQVTAAITAIGDDSRTPIRYPQAVWDDEQQRWISDAEVAEVPLTVFTSRRKADHVDCRLVVRRVKRLQPSASDGTNQGELFASYRHHAFITNSTLTTVEADARHRDHAVVVQVIAELKDGPLAHLPSGSYAANAAWLAHAVIAFNLARAAGVLASTRHARARWATLRTQLINVPPASRPRHAGSCCTCRSTGRGHRPGLHSSSGPPAHPARGPPDQPAARRQTEDPKWKSRADRRITPAELRALRLKRDQDAARNDLGGSGLKPRARHDTDGGS